MKAELTRSIIHGCPAIKMEAFSFAEKLAGVNRLIVLKGASEEDAKLILHAINSIHYNAQLAIALREAATVISKIPEAVANTMQVRHFLPDELEGFALIYEGETEATKG